MVILISEKTTTGIEDSSNKEGIKYVNLADVFGRMETNETGK